MRALKDLRNTQRPIYALWKSQEEGAENLLKETMAKNFPNWRNIKNLAGSRMNPKDSHQDTFIIIKLSKDNES